MVIDSPGPSLFDAFWKLPAAQPQAVEGVGHLPKDHATGKIGFSVLLLEDQLG
jgi:hypothetical protein